MTLSNKLSDRYKTRGKWCKWLKQTLCRVKNLMLLWLVTEFQQIVRYKWYHQNWLVNKSYKCNWQINNNCHKLTKLEKSQKQAMRIITWRLFSSSSSINHSNRIWNHHRWYFRMSISLAKNHTLQLMSLMVTYITCISRQERWSICSTRSSVLKTSI